MRGIAADARLALRGGLADRPWWAGPRLVLACAPVAGLASGSFSVDEPSRVLFMAFAAVKTPILVLATAALCLPGFYALHVVTGARRDFGAALRGVLAGQALFAIVLASLAPMLPVWYSAFGTSKRLAVLGAAGLFAIAGACSMIGVRRALAVCPRRGGRCWLLGAWFTLYAFVGMQMGWMLRPFIGSPELPPQMLREDALTNGYVVIFRLAFGD